MAHNEVEPIGPTVTAKQLADLIVVLAGCHGGDFDRDDILAGWGFGTAGPDENAEAAIVSSMGAR